MTPESSAPAAPPRVRAAAGFAAELGSGQGHALPAPGLSQASVFLRWDGALQLTHLAAPAASTFRACLSTVDASSFSSFRGGDRVPHRPVQHLSCDIGSEHGPGDTAAAVEAFNVPGSSRGNAVILWGDSGAFWLSRCKEEMLSLVKPALICSPDIRTICRRSSAPFTLTHCPQTAP